MELWLLRGLEMPLSPSEVFGNISTCPPCSAPLYERFGCTASLQDNSSQEDECYGVVCERCIICIQKQRLEPQMSSQTTMYHTSPSTTKNGHW
jgi:hypothetical protein